uniref:Single-stranded DNA-binding protein n=1 Tax=Paulinella longichromatophora TaxID=1708747 RepID=A0A2H4ZQM8_9EUKA|nr:hypothetical protein PLO_872 [Paulinella longichromatophora]
MNHCLLEVLILETPQVKHQSNPEMAEMMVEIQGLKSNDPTAKLRVVAWGNLARELTQNIEVGQSWLFEGRLRMSTNLRSDGLKEKKAEMIISKLHSINRDYRGGDSKGSSSSISSTVIHKGTSDNLINEIMSSKSVNSSWNTSPLIPDTLEDDEDEIPF